MIVTTIQEVLQWMLVVFITGMLVGMSLVMWFLKKIK